MMGELPTRPASLYPPAARRAAARQSAVGTPGDEGDRVMALVQAHLFLRLEPRLPFLPAIFGQHGDRFHALLEGKLPRPGTGEHDVFGALHDHAGHRNGMSDFLDGGDAAGVVTMVHDAGVELHDAVRVGRTAEADRMVGGVGFDLADTWPPATRPVAVAAAA